MALFAFVLLFILIFLYVIFSWSLHSNSALFLGCIWGIGTRQLRLEHFHVGGSFERVGTLAFFYPGDYL